MNLPIRKWVATYRREWLSGDLVAGLTVAAATIPAALAYAQLAGLPAVYGLYASVVPAFLYAIFGTSRQLQIGPGSTLSILVAASLAGTLVSSNPDEAVVTAALLALGAGSMLLVAGLLRLGFIADFLSAPVLTGFTSGAALIIIASQLPKVFGLEVDGDGFFETVWGVVSSLGETNVPTLALASAAALLLLVMRQWLPMLPASLIVVALGIVAVTAFDLTQEGVSVVGEIPAGLPGVVVPDLGGITGIFGASAAVALLVYVETIAVSREFAGRYGYKIDPNQELIASGAANLGAGLFQGFPVDGSFSQSALNDSAGARTQLAGVVTALAVAVVLLAFTGLLADLPNSVLGAIIIVAVLPLVKIGEIRRLWRLQRGSGRDPVWLPARLDLASAAVTFTGTLLLGILPGILIGVAITILALLQRATRPNVAELGLVPGERAYRDVARQPEAETVPGLVILRWDGELFFANISHFCEQVMSLVEGADPEPNAVLLDASAITSVDVTAADMLAELIDDLQDRGLVVLLARARGPLRDIFVSTELEQEILSEHRFRSVRRAVEYYRTDLAK
ncbi:MAG: sulfate permease [Thermoleophilia bacterium]|nr:sulfate permease [Thermoleophilia bacterium]